MSGLCIRSVLVVQSEQHVIYRFMADGRWGARRPKLTWKKLTEKDFCYVFQEDLRNEKKYRIKLLLS